MQNHDTTTDLMLARAALTGAADVMGQTHHAQAAILSTLMDDTLELNDFQRHGLLAALEAINNGIGHRADHIRREVLA